MVILIGVSPATGGGVEVPSDGVVVGGDDSTSPPGESGLPAAVSRASGSGHMEQAAHNIVARASGRASGQVAAEASHLAEVRNIIVMAFNISWSQRRVLQRLVK
jgi:hypothetical protein